MKRKHEASQPCGLGRYKVDQLIPCRFLALAGRRSVKELAKDQTEAPQSLDVVVAKLGEPFEGSIGVADIETGSGVEHGRGLVAYLSVGAKETEVDLWAERHLGGWL